LTDRGQYNPADLKEVPFAADRQRGRHTDRAEGCAAKQLVLRRFNLQSYAKLWCQRFWKRRNTRLSRARAIGPRNCKASETDSMTRGGELNHIPRGIGWGRAPASSGCRVLPGPKLDGQIIDGSPQRARDPRGSRRRVAVNDRVLGRNLRNAREREQ